jgi:hypothetical protein
MADNYEIIKDRMLRNASRMWGVTTRENEAAFDPLVGLLIEACASEMDGLSREISNSHLRLTQKLIELMNPGIDSGVLPAHCIAKADPAEATLDISPDTNFVCRTSSMHKNKSEDDDTLFIPTGNYKLFDASIEMMVHQGRLYQPSKSINNGQLKHTEDLTISSNPLQLWFCLRINKKVKNLNNMNFYFNITGNVERKNFYRLLDQSQWSINDKAITVQKGLNTIENNETIIEKKLKGQTTKLEESLNEITSYHSEYFRTISQSEDLKNTYHPGPGISKEDMADMGYNPNEMHWIGIAFNQAPKSQTIDNIICHINSFPIANLISKSVQAKSREHLNLIPLNTDNNYFFDIKNIQDSSGDTYKENISFVKTRKKTKNYVLRSDGVQSFDNRSARELLTTVIEKLKNENAAFRFLDLPSVTEDIRTLHQLVSRLETKLQKSPELKRSVFLYLEGSTINDHLFVDFWTTSGSAGNDITTDSKLELLEGADLKPDSAKLLTNTRGGTDKLNLDEKLNVYRKALLTRNRIVTAEDLKAFCYTWFGDILKDVEIKKGVSQASANTGGLVRCMEIHLTTKTSFKLNEDSQLWCNDFLVHLQKRSNNTFPYKLIINHKTIEL